MYRLLLSVLTPLGHQLPLLEQQARRDAMLAGDGRDRHARLQGDIDQGELRIGTIPAPTLAVGDDFVGRFIGLAAR
jgi:hypothetical protein